MTNNPCPSCVETIADETGWLIELPFTARSGQLCWVAITDKPFPMFRTLNHNEDYDFQRVASPLEFVTDSNLALRFARKSDAEAFIKMFDKFLIGPVATEHQWMNHTPKSPAQALAEECPHGMTEEQAQWVLDRFDHQKDTPMEIQNLVSRFLQWPLPKAVCSDACVSMPDYKFPRSGTNLLTATEAEQMLRFVLSDLLDPEWGGDLTAEETSMIDAAWEKHKKGRDHEHG